MFYGSMVAIVTPMHLDGTVDFASFSHLLNWHIENKTNAIVVLGTTGESPTINDSEREAIIKHAIKEIKGRVPVIVGTGVNCTHEAIALTRHAMEMGADACLLVTPYYNKPTQEGLIQHFTAVAEAVAIPQIMYNVPSRTGCDLLPASAIQLSSVSNIIGMKESSGDLTRVTQILSACEQPFDLFTGNDDNTFDFMALGGKGVISVTANVAPAYVQDMCAAMLAGDIKRGEELYQKLLPLHQGLFMESNPIPVKWALHEMGLIPAGIRLPLTPLSFDKRESLKSVLRQIGI